MRQTKQISLTACLLTVGVLLAGCTADTADSETEQTETTVAEATAVTETEAETETTEAPTEATTEAEETYATIGVVSEEGYAIPLTNSMGKDIVEIMLYSLYDTETGDNYLEEEDVFAADETRIFYYVPTDEEAEYLSNDEMVLSLTLADDTVYELHILPLDEIESAEILVEDTMAYLTYTSTETAEDISTFTAEQAYLESLTAVEETEATIEAVTEAETIAQTEIATEVVTEAITEAVTEEVTEAITEEIATEEATEAATEEVTEVVTEADADDGCIGDGGLFY